MKWLDGPTPIGGALHSRLQLCINRPRPRPRPRKFVSPSTPEVLSIRALGYFGTADLTRPQVEDEDDDEDD